MTNIYVSQHLEIKTGLITKIPNNETHLSTGKINVKHQVIRAKGQLSNRNRRTIEQCLDEEDYIIHNNYTATNIVGGARDVHLPYSELTSLFEKSYFSRK